MREETATKVNGMAVALVGDTNLSPKTPDYGLMECDRIENKN